MWRLGVVLILAASFASGASDDLEYGPLLQRLKRSPPFCQPFYPPPPPPYWPPPHHPRFWPPHPPPPPPQWYQNEQPNNQAYSAADAQANSNAAEQHFERNQLQQPPHQQGQSNGGLQLIGSPPCATCSNHSTAVSNAESEQGDAIAVAIARARTN